MKPYLAIDTSTALGSVAVGRGSELLAEIVVGVSTKHSESLLPAIDYALRSAGLEPPDLGAVVVAGGPGSFTGVRVAGATAKGFVRALGVPLAYSGLLALAAAAEGPVCALFDARRGEVYAGCWRFPGDGAVEVIMPPTAAPVEEVLTALAGTQPRFVGEGALRYRDAIESAGGRVAPAHQAAPRASALLWLADIAPALGLVATRGREPE